MLLDWIWGLLNLDCGSGGEGMRGSFAMQRGDTTQATKEQAQ